MLVHFFADGMFGARQTIGMPQMFGTNELAIPFGTASVKYAHLLVFTQSALVEQTTPGSSQLSDTGQNISSIVYGALRIHVALDNLSIC